MSRSPSPPHGSRISVGYCIVWSTGPLKQKNEVAHSPKICGHTRIKHRIESEEVDLGVAVCAGIPEPLAALP